MKQLPMLILVTGAAVLVACATPAPAPAPPVAAAKPVPATPAAATPQATKVPYGYERVVLSNGEERFCRNEQAPDSRTAHQRVCLTAAQLQATQDSSQDYIKELQRQSATSSRYCTPGPAGCPGGQ
ncbi:MAG TPA: hypothetical protein VK700_16730 [Steroidobacteraceae bacterium]|jgi:hypothetical protein|nr:hypothetical protein [Steroidobacteraceae bacterium]